MNRVKFPAGRFRSPLRPELPAMRKRTIRVFSLRTGRCCQQQLERALTHHRSMGAPCRRRSDTASNIRRLGNHANDFNKAG